MSKKIVVIGDVQVKPGQDLSHVRHMGQYIADKRPDVIVIIGDWWDFESLSSYDKGKKSFEGRRLKADIEAGNEAMEVFFAPILALQKRQKEAKKKVYDPRRIFVHGNHEKRFDTLSENMPELDGFVGTETLALDKWGFEVYPFLQPVEVQGIFFVHYLANPMTGKPYGGTALNQLKTVGRSFVVGHKQVLDIAIRPTIDNKMQFAVINGASYPHDEDYKGFQGNNHFRGIMVLNEAEDGFALPMPVSLQYLAQRYSKTNVSNQ